MSCAEPTPTPSAHSLDEALALVRSRGRELSAETVALSSALGRMLREEVTVPEDQPPFDRSAMDGYAVRAGETATLLRVVDQVRAGEWKPRTLGAAEAVRVGTGAALPGESMWVVPQEDVEREGDQISLVRPAGDGWVRRRGEDARKGEKLLASGVRLDPGSLALLSALGRAEVRVARLPRVVHVVTGDELIAPGEALKPGRIYDSNSTLIRALLAERGIAVVHRAVPEGYAPALATLENVLSDPADLLLLSGGASVGEHDATGRLLEAFGYRRLITKTNLRPGRPLIFAESAAGLAFGLPGNPVAHWVCFHLYVATALERLAGSRCVPDFVKVPLAAAYTSAPNSRESLLPARLGWTEHGLSVRSVGLKSSGDVTCLAGTNALLRVPPGCGSIAAGTLVSVWPVQTSAAGERTALA